jgi:transcriptional regulator with XRE-family HTH domain
MDDEGWQMTITVEQVKEARKLLGWSQFRLAVRSTVDVTRINHFERGMCALAHSQLERIRSSLELSGLEFVAENGGRGREVEKSAAAMSEIRQTPARTMRQHLSPPR